jgi:hypothetical protein
LEYLRTETQSGSTPKGDKSEQGGTRLPNCHEPYFPELTIAAGDFIVITGDHATSKA